MQMDQPICADLEYQGKKRMTRRELFLERMEGLIPWQLLEDSNRLSPPPSPSWRCRGRRSEDNAPSDRLRIPGY